MGILGSFNLGGIVSPIMGWFSSLFWIGLIVLGIFIGFVGILIWNKRKKYIFPVVEITGLGKGKVSLDYSKAGWFKKKKVFFGLIEKGGEEELICKRGNRKIYYVSSQDYHDINGKRGIICKRKDDDPEILVPLSKVEIKNPEVIAEIAPADFRDVAVQILDEKKKESLTWWEQNAPLVITLGILGFALIALIIIFQFAKGESSAWREAMIQMKTLASSAP